MCTDKNICNYKWFKAFMAIKYNKTHTGYQRHQVLKQWKNKLFKNHLHAHAQRNNLAGNSVSVINIPAQTQHSWLHASQMRTGGQSQALTLPGPPVWLTVILTVFLILKGLWVYLHSKVLFSPTCELHIFADLEVTDLIHATTISFSSLDSLSCYISL
jgi:hypothetical protein